MQNLRDGWGEHVAEAVAHSDTVREAEFLKAQMFRWKAMTNWVYSRIRNFRKGGAEVILTEKITKAENYPFENNEPVKAEIFGDMVLLRKLSKVEREIVERLMEKGGVGY